MTGIPAFISRTNPGLKHRNTLVPRFFIRVVDGAERPLAEERYAIHQDGKKDEGILPADGRVFFDKVKHTEPFRFEVRGRVCSILEGAAFLPEQLDKSVTEGGIEYGGTFFDWTWADDERDNGKKADVFWQEYANDRGRLMKGPSTFWQHEHISRRDIRISRKYLRQFPTCVAVLKAIPLQIRVGPLVRFTSHETAVIWVELETPGLVRVKVEEIAVKASATEPKRIVSHGGTVRVGGRDFAGIPIYGLSADTSYRYTLELAPLPAVGGIPVEGEFSDEVFPHELSSKILSDIKRQLGVCSFADSDTDQGWMSFRTLKQNYKENLRFAHGSCRKSDARGDDAMEYLAYALPKAEMVDWPSFLLLTGDQIYADDISVEIGSDIAQQRFGARVPGPRDGDETLKGGWAGRFAHRYIAMDPQKRKLWERGSVEPLQAKYKKWQKAREALLAEIRGTPFASDEKWKRLREITDVLLKIKTQIDTWHEHFVFWKFISQEDLQSSRYALMVTNHLLWQVPVREEEIPVITPLELRQRDDPTVFYAAAGDRAGIHAADFAEFAFLYEKAWGGNSFDNGRVRQVLANLPTYMIFDDHEITDDWNFDDKWIDIIRTGKDPKHYWPRTIGDGLAAYWIYQGWGNLDPAQWENDGRMKILLEARKLGTDALPKLRKRLQDEVQPPAGYQGSGRLSWSYRLPFAPTFLVLDGRTRRVLRATPHDSQVMTNDEFDWLESELEGADRAREVAAFVVAPGPVVLPAALALGQGARLRDEPGLQDEIARSILDEAMRRERDIEHWMADGSWDKLRQIFERLSAKRKHLKTVIFLSGDVHFSYNMLATISEKKNGAFPELLQLVCSALRNQQSATGEYKARKIMEPNADALEDIKEKVDRIKMSFFRWLATPSGIDSKFEGMDLRLAGFRGHENPASALIIENSVALVDALFSRRPGELVLRERYLSNHTSLIDPGGPNLPDNRFMFGPPVPGNMPTTNGAVEFWYQTNANGSTMTLPRLAGSGS